ncbi:MAG TPA: sulfatase-like hydrolase/transferase, partial [Phnomibacter sp.]|nr:sulfatase-like hydrolase/transferase [Phnomibacter sp.]
DKNTIIIFSSDNGPVLDDGYEDGAVTQLNGHTPWGPLRGGKYSVLEAGTRVPFILSWPGQVPPKVSDALVCQIDLIRSFSAFFRQTIPAGECSDSEDTWSTLVGKTETGRNTLIEQGANLGLIQGNSTQSQAALALIQNDWKYIPPNNGPANTNPQLTNIETGNSPQPQLYNLKEDIGERNNLAEKYPEKVKEMEQMLKKIAGR